MKRERIYRCPKCQEEVVDRKAVKIRLEKGFSNIRCNYCDYAIELSDLIEETVGKDDQFLTKVGQMDKEIKTNLDNASKRVILEGEFMTLVGKAGQIPRLIQNDDWGIDGEIEFKNDQGQASGERIYVQLKSGASYLNKRKDGVRTFQMKNKRHIEYWQAQRYPVYLIIRDENEKIYWMNITKYLKNRNDKDNFTIVFDGEELTVKAIQSVRHFQLTYT
ncbi:MAG TPA: DUF4365 domain-containing protein [Leptolyngbyaceae cyanobacterium]